jgi:DMSO/TMAO reductase YedYZ molybdopterin-dependent catalytic subunit
MIPSSRGSRAATLALRDARQEKSVAWRRRRSVTFVAGRGVSTGSPMTGRRAWGTIAPMQIREHLPSHRVPAAARGRASQATLRIDGLVARPLASAQPDRPGSARAVVEEPFVCEEGWSVPGLRWGGVPLAEVLALAGPVPGARYIRAGAGPYVAPVPLSEAGSALLADELGKGSALGIPS